MKTILVPTDFNACAGSAVRRAVDLAKEKNASLVVLYADRFEPPAEFTATQVSDVAEAIEQSRRRTAEELERWTRAIVAGAVPFKTMVREGYPVDAIVQAAEELDAEMIVMGSHGHGAISRLLMGSVTAGVKRRSKRPVLTVAP